MDGYIVYFSLQYYVLQICKTQELRKMYLPRNKDIKSMVGVKFILPFHLPLKDESKFIINYQKTNFSVIIKQHETKEHVLENLSFENFKTEVEITIFKVKRLSTEEEDIKNNREITLALKFLNHFIKSVKVKYDFQELRVIARQDLLQIIPVRFYTTPSFKEKHIRDYGIENIHFKNIPSYHNELYGEELTRLAEFIAHNNQNPYIDSLYYIKRSHNLIHDGEYQFGVMSLQTGIEMFMYTLMKEILKYSGSSDVEIENKLKAGYKNILNDHLKKEFEKEGYIFSFRKEHNSKNLLFNYREKLYNLRNKIVHEGYNCTEEEAVTASEVGSEVIKGIVDAINNSDLQKSAFRGQRLIN